MPNAIPDGYTAVTPWIISVDTARLLEFIANAFGGKEISRMADERGAIQHAEIRIGDAVIMAFDAPDGIEPTPAFMRLYVPDTPIAFARALDAGATEVTRPTLLAFGDRVARVRDPLGNIWWLQQHVEDVNEAQMLQRWSDPRWSEPMAYVQRTLAAALKPHA